ncbi:MAG: winged helix-turn-helix domain-containing protein [Crocinitomicaceae bacterium]|nr:winged helix-turn-helix domain-containing protein [Crocinitomicaceae bacterium]MCF8411700.1 winged helix-turn-helix domain-containing protein [Crocinitomicaceae bacterium]
MIPTYEEIMLPFLKLLAEGNEYSLSQTHDTLSKHFHLTDAEIRELLPSGQQAIFRNRVGWARTYLKKAGLLS